MQFFGTIFWYTTLLQEFEMVQRVLNVYQRQKNIRVLQILYILITDWFQKKYVKKAVF